MEENSSRAIKYKKVSPSAQEILKLETEENMRSINVPLLLY